MLTPEQILEIARAHCFYPDSDLTALVRAIEQAARREALESVLAAISAQDEACTGASMQVKCLRATRALMEKEA